MGTKKYNERIDKEVKFLNQKYEKSMIILIKNEGGKKMKILFPIETLCKGGGQRMLAEIMNGLAIKGHDVTILMPPSGKVYIPQTPN